MKIILFQLGNILINCAKFIFYFIYFSKYFSIKFHHFYSKYTGTGIDKFVKIVQIKGVYLVLIN